MHKLIVFMSHITDVFIKLSLGLLFFNYGYGKMQSLITGNSQSLENMISSIPIFGYYPIFFSWCTALSETLIIFFLIYGLFVSFPYAALITRLSGLLSLLISLIIVYQHVVIWGDNIFAYGPFDYLNIDEGKKSIFGQFLLIPISMYIIFSSRMNYHIPQENK